jgi:large subunit ribosomal protein L25
MSSEKHKLSVAARSVSGRKVKKLRAAGLIPGNIFGKKITSVSVQFDAKQFSQIFAAAGESSLVYLHIDSEKDPRPSFISQISRNPISNNIIHVTFHQVDLKEKVTAPVPVILVGEPLAEKEKTGIMVQQADEIEIEALPSDMPENIKIDVVNLAQPGDHISVKDLRLDSSKLVIKSDPELILVQIEALAKEEVAPVVEAPVAEAEAAPAGTEPAAAPEEKSAPAKE